MGHGYNHYSNCNCPWCINYGRGRINKQELLFAFEKRLNEFKEYFSFTNPNANCKFCGQSIFFYQNSYGSRVFFDMLGKPWTKHKCYYEIVQDYFEEEIDLTLENLPDLLLDKVYNVNNNVLVQIDPKIKTRLLKNHIIIEFENSIQHEKKEFIVEYDKLEFGLCFYNKETNTIEGFLGDESYSLSCIDYEKARREIKDIFPYEIGEETIIEIFKENANKDIVTVYYTLTVRNFSKRPEAFMNLKTMNENTINLLYKSNGIKLTVNSKLINGTKIEFIEIE